MEIDCFDIRTLRAQLRHVDRKEEFSKCRDNNRVDNDLANVTDAQWANRK